MKSENKKKMKRKESKNLADTFVRGGWREKKKEKIIVNNKQLRPQSVCQRD